MAKNVLYLSELNKFLESVDKDYISKISAVDNNKGWNHARHKMSFEKSTVYVWLSTIGGGKKNWYSLNFVCPEEETITIKDDTKGHHGLDFINSLPRLSNIADASRWVLPKGYILHDVNGRTISDYNIQTQEDEEELAEISTNISNEESSIDSKDINTKTSNKIRYMDRKEFMSIVDDVATDNNDTTLYSIMADFLSSSTHDGKFGIAKLIKDMDIKITGMNMASEKDSSIKEDMKKCISNYMKLLKESNEQCDRYASEFREATRYIVAYKKTDKKLVGILPEYLVEVVDTFPGKEGAIARYKTYNRKFLSYEYITNTFGIQPYLIGQSDHIIDILENEGWSLEDEEEE